MERVFQNTEGIAFLDKDIFINKELLEKVIFEIKPQLEKTRNNYFLKKIRQKEMYVSFL
jgi:hypothetical protein